MSTSPPTSNRPDSAAAPAAERPGRQRLSVQLDRPTSTSIIVHVAGELDANTSAHLRELLEPRLVSNVETIVLDLSQVKFLGVAGLEVLADAHDRAGQHEITVCLVDGPRCVERALRVATWGKTISRYHTVQAAISELSGRAR